MADRCRKEGGLTNPPAPDEGTAAGEIRVNCSRRSRDPSPNIYPEVPAAPAARSPHRCRRAARPRAALPMRAMRVAPPTPMRIIACIVVGIPTRCVCARATPHARAALPAA